MQSTANPGWTRRQLAGELRRLRERGGRSIAEVAQGLTWSPSKLSRVETGRTGIRTEDLQQLLRTYGATDEECERIGALAVSTKQSRQGSWLGGYRGVLPESYEEFLRLEADARLAWAYEATVVHGLLRTAEYASALARAVLLRESGDALGTRVAAQLARQAVLTREPPLDLTVVLDEAVLRRPIGAPGVMHRQMLRLIEVSKQPSVSVRVLPFEAGAHPALDGSFTFLEVDNEPRGSVIYGGGLNGGIVMRDRDNVQSYRLTFERVLALALGPEDSISLVTDMSQHYA